MRKNYSIYSMGAVFYENYKRNLQAAAAARIYYDRKTDDNLRNRIAAGSDDAAFCRAELVRRGADPVLAPLAETEQ